MENKGMRLQKYMAKCNVASRRKSEKIIAEGRVKVNEKKITEQGSKVYPGDVVTVDDKVITLQKEKIYIMLNKPKGYITTMDDEFDRKTVCDLIQNAGERLYPVGRLDKDTKGLLLFTNDGDFHYHMTHPSHEVDKEYIAGINGSINQDTIRLFKKGIYMDGSVTAPAKIFEISRKETYSTVKIIIHEGKKRQIKRMLQECNFNTLFLKRIRIGGIKLGNLPLGKWRHLTKKELQTVGYL